MAKNERGDIPNNAPESAGFLLPPRYQNNYNHSERIGTVMSHPIPRATLDTLKEVLEAYNKIADPGEKITDEGVEEVREVSENTAKRQKKFFVDLGILTKEGYDHLLSETGHEIGHLLVFNEDEEAGELFRDLLDNWEPTAEILAYIDSDGISRDDLMNIVGRVTATELTSNRIEYGALAVIDALEWTGFIERREDGNYYQSAIEPEMGEEDGAKTVAEPPTTSSATQSEPTGAGQPRPDPSVDGGAIANPTVATTGVDINLDVSGSDDPENVRQLLLAIRKGSEEDVENYAVPEEDA